MGFVIFQLGGRQYLARPRQILEVDKLPGNQKTLSVDKVLLEVSDSKVEIGKPYLQKTLNFEVLGNVKKEKIRVATYKAKANYRRVKGQKREMSRIRLMDETEKTKTVAKPTKTVKNSS